MNSSFARSTVLALASLLGAGCFTAELELDLGGAYACGTDDEDSACPSGLRCVNERCEQEDTVPELLVLSPEDEQVLDTRLPDLPMGPSPETYPLTIRIQGSLELVAADSGAAHVFGQGHVAVFIDAVEQVIIDSGSLSGGTPVEVEFDNVAGPHRISLEARRNDGIPYDNAEAVATRLFWLETALIRGQHPFVAIKSPWPGTEFPLDDTDIEIEVAKINFSLIAADVGEQEGRGHAHIYYDVTLPDCVDDAACDGSYLGVASTSPITSIAAPASEATTATLSAVLRHVGHDPYFFPFGCDPEANPELCRPIFDSVTIVRAAL